MKDSGCLTAILLLAAVGLLGPILVFGIGWVGGAIPRWAFGDMIASGMNLLFHTSSFTPDVIPIACGTLSVIGSYFKSSLTTRKE